MSSRRLALGSLGLAFLLALAAGTTARADRGFYGSTGVYAGDPTTTGDWNGTWMYVWRDGRMALWIRDGKDGRPEARLEYQSTSNAETFGTDWSGKATYYLSGQPATFEIRLAERAKDEIAGRWEWRVEFPDSGRSEIGDFRMYRVGNGRLLAFEFQKGYAKTIRRHDRVTKLDTPPVFNFVKASRRLVLWDELPW